MPAKDQVIIKHVFRAKPELVFKAWTNPALMQRWMDGTCDEFEQVLVTQAKTDLRVGGRFELMMQDRLLHSGEYQEINPPHRLVFTWDSDFVKNSLVTVEIKSLGDQTELTLTHERLTPDLVSSHTKGWGRVLMHLEQAFKRERIA